MRIRNSTLVAAVAIVVLSFIGGTRAIAAAPAPSGHGDDLVIAVSASPRFVGSWHNAVRARWMETAVRAARTGVAASMAMSAAISSGGAPKAPRFLPAGAVEPRDADSSAGPPPMLWLVLGAGGLLLAAELVLRLTPPCLRISSGCRDAVRARSPR